MNRLRLPIPLWRGDRDRTRIRANLVGRASDCGGNLAFLIGADGFEEPIARDWRQGGGALRITPIPAANEPNPIRADKERQRAPAAVDPAQEIRADSEAAEADGK